MSDPLKHVVDSRGELVRPLPVPVANKKVAALIGRRVLDRAEQQVFERFWSRFDTYADAASLFVRQSPLSATAVIPLARNLLSRAIAGVDVMRRPKPDERLFVETCAIALSQQWPQPLIRLEPEPLEILEDCHFVFGPASDAIVIFDAQQHPPSCLARHAPHVDRVDNVADV